MSASPVLLDALRLPLRGSSLIEASAGTGKTWTIAALYVRLVLGHGGAEHGPVRPLMPQDILVMTFTRAATRELSDRIRARLGHTAATLRAPQRCDPEDSFMVGLLQDLPSEDERQRARNRRHRMVGDGVLGLFQHLLHQPVELGELLADPVAGRVHGRMCLFLGRARRVAHPRQFRPQLVQFRPQRLAAHVRAS